MRRRGVSLAPLFIALWCFAVTAAVAEDLQYHAKVDGVGDDRIREALEGVSVVIRDRNRAPPSEAALRRRTEEDRPRLEQAMASFGYYDAKIEFRIDAKVNPVHVVIAVTPGPPYQFVRYTVHGDAPALRDGSIKVPAPADLGLTLNTRAESKAILDAEQKLLASFADQAHPLAKVLDRRVVVDHAARSVVADTTVDPGPAARFGPVTFKGVESVDQAFIFSRLPWKQGEAYDQQKVDAGRGALVGTGLFTSVAVKHADAVAPDGSLPITIEVAEAKHRSIGAGASYSSSVGPTGNVFWEHRNLFGSSESLRISAFGGTETYGAAIDLTLPGVDDPARTLQFGAHAAQENRDAYNSNTFDLTAGISYRFSDTLTGTAALNPEYLIVESEGNTDNFLLMGVPLSLRHDTTGAPLDPRHGHRWLLEVNPYASMDGQSVNFVMNRVTASHYFPLVEDESLVLAGWGRVASILGEDRDDIPANKRLYGGGGGSVRAYGFQDLGPQDSHGDPVGGRSQLEFGGELRWRFLEDFGAVAFLEGGNVYDDTVPDLKEKIFWGAGTGLRYYTSFGPVRFDIAFPLNGRSDDELLQFYISLGQAF